MLISCTMEQEMFCSFSARTTFAARTIGGTGSVLQLSSSSMVSWLWRSSLTYEIPMSRSRLLKSWLLMPWFPVHHYVAVIPHPYCRSQMSVVTKKSVRKFRSVRAVNGKNRPLPFVRWKDRFLRWSVTAQPCNQRRQQLRRWVMWRVWSPGKTHLISYW